MAMVGPEPVTSVSIGLVSHPEDGLSAEELMAAADRAMYQAKRLGKNQISGNPRPRPALLARRATAEPPEPIEPIEPVEPIGPVEPMASREGDGSEPDDAPSSAERQRGPMESVTAPREDRAVAVELGPIPVGEPGSGSRQEEVDDADPQEVRRRIASASRSFDPDHQIRRAMDAFLSPVPDERERRTPDH